MEAPVLSLSYKSTPCKIIYTSCSGKYGSPSLIPLIQVHPLPDEQPEDGQGAVPSQTLHVVQLLLAQVPAPQPPEVSVLVPHPVEAMVASVEDSGHPVTILHLQVYVIVLQQHLHYLDVPRAHGQHERSEASWPHV